MDARRPRRSTSPRTKPRARLIGEPDAGDVRRPSKAIHFPPADPLEALQEATRHFQRPSPAGNAPTPSPPRRARPAMAVLSSLLVGLLVGTAVFFLTPPRFAATAAIKLTGETGQDVITLFRQSLVAYLIQNDSTLAASSEASAAAAAQGTATDQGAQPDPTTKATDLTAPNTTTPLGPAPWTVHDNGSDALYVTRFASLARNAVAAATKDAAGFVGQMKQEADQARTQPGEAERIMQRFADQLRRRLERAESEVERAVASLPDSDPRADRQDMLSRWHSSRRSLDDLRRQLDSQKHELHQLQSKEEPAAVVIDEANRETAQQADVTLQQDLRELTVEMTKLKAETVSVLVDARAPLIQLTAAAESARIHPNDVRRDGLTANQPAGATHEEPSDRRPQPATNASDASSEAVEAFLTEANAYAEAFSTFAAQWNAQAGIIDDLAIDPMSRELLDHYEQARSLLSDFLFSSSKRLSSMRHLIQSLNEGNVDSARHHVLNSALTRNNERLQMAHRRFELAADAIEPSGNRRIDLQLRLCRRFYRRSQLHVRDIEEQLAKQASEDARARRRAALSAIQASLRDTRNEIDQSIDHIITLQEDLNLTTDLSAEFLHAYVSKEKASEWAQQALGDLETTQDIITGLKAERLQRIDQTTLEVTNVRADEWPVNSAARLRPGGIAALATFVITLLAFWRLRA